MVTVVLTTALVFGCATDPQVLTKQTPSGQQQVNVPVSTWTGASSGEQSIVIAKETVEANNVAVKEFGNLNGHLEKQDKQMAVIQGIGEKDLKTTEAALAKLEKISKDQGTGQITLFFKTKSDKLDNEQRHRLIAFLDYLSCRSYGRKIIMVSVGSASAVLNEKAKKEAVAKHHAANKKLSIARAEAPRPIIDKYLLNVPYELNKVLGVGDAYAPKGASKQIEERYQNVRIIAVYDAADVPAIPETK